MNKLFIRLFVAFVAFSFGLVLTNLIKQPVRLSQRAVPIVIYTPSEYSADEDQIRNLYREYGPAQTQHDREFFERVETEDFTLTVGSLKMSREEDIRWMEEQSTDKIYLSKVDHVKVFGRLAVAHGFLEVRNGDGSIRDWPFADVWVKRNGTWRIQSTVSQ
jgi:hypothetical protein